MRVVYETPIWQKITNARIAAEKEHKRIDYIGLTKDEMNELQSHCWPSFYSGTVRDLYIYDGVKLKEVE